MSIMFAILKVSLLYFMCYSFNSFYRLFIYFWENTQALPQPMSELSETHLYYTEVVLPPELIL